jgi:hypothetical protein
MATDRIIERFRASLHEADGKTLKKGEELQLMALKSPAVHFALFTTITDVDNNIRPPVPNILQLRMSQVYETLLDMGIPPRIIVVKPRQVGCSTFAAEVGYHHGQRFRTTGLTISDKKPHSAALKEKISEYYKVDTFPWGNEMTRNPSGFVAWSNGTVWHIDTAEDPNAGVGNTYQFFHASEVAKWPQTTVKNDVSTMTAVLPALNGTRATVIAESTPEGPAGWHYSTWTKAVTLDEFLRRWEQGYRDEMWIKVFAAWWEFPDHATPVTKQEILEMRRTLTDVEIHEIRSYKLSWEQLKWRRATVKNKCDGQERRFSYYYPSDEVSCWLASGSPRFDMQIIQEMSAWASGQAKEVGYLITQENGSVVFQRDIEGDIEIWENAQEGLKYLVAIDPATDESQTIGADPDRHSVLVWRKGYYCQDRGEERPAKLVARVKAPFYANGDKVAGHAVRLSRFYGNAIVCQEVMCGLNILEHLKLSGVPLYKRKPLSHRTGQIVEQYGFKLKSKEERDAMVDRMAIAISEGYVEIPCLHTLGEASTFIRHPNGKAAARLGAHDDDISSCMMAWEVMDCATMFRGHSVKPKAPRDRGKNGWRSVIKHF